MPMRICAMRSNVVLLFPLKSDRNFSISVEELLPHRDELLALRSGVEPSGPFVARGWVAEGLLGITTCTIIHSKASWFSAALCFLVLCAVTVFSLIHSRISERVWDL